MKSIRWLLPVLTLLMLCVNGCALSGRREAVYVQDGIPVKLREDIEAKVWVPTAKGLKPATMYIPAGWWAMYIPEEDEK